MIFLTGSSGPMSRTVADRIGILCTPVTSYRPQRPLYRCWAADNGQYAPPGEKPKTTVEQWWSWLQKQDPDGARFASAPDVVADWDATWERSAPWLERIRALGFPAALVAQDGCTPPQIFATADEWDVLFIGGSTAWKLSHIVVDLIAAAHDLGRPVHAGRVNSYRRIAHFAAIGADTADGNFLGRAPDINVPRMLAWLDKLEHSPALPL